MRINFRVALGDYHLAFSSKVHNISPLETASDTQLGL